MNFNVTCVCGHPFQITIQQVNRHVTCPSCNRALIPVAAIRASDTGGESTGSAPGGVERRSGAEPTKRCPFCGEIILAYAKKCKHCGEFLDRAAPGEPPMAPPVPESKPIFVLSVSQWDNFWRYLTCIAIQVIVGLGLYWGSAASPWLSKYAPQIFIVVFIVNVIAVYFFYLGASRARCYVRPNRIDTEVGILSRKTDYVEMFRIKDLQLQQGFIQRILGIGTILISSNDETTPELELYQIPHVRKVYNYLQDQIPKADAQRRVLRMES